MRACRGAAPGIETKICIIGARRPPPTRVANRTAGTRPAASDADERKPRDDVSRLESTSEHALPCNATPIRSRGPGRRSGWQPPRPAGPPPAPRRRTTRTPGPRARGRARRGGAAGRAITKVKYAVRVSTSASGVRTNWLTGVGTSRVSRRAPPRTARHMQPNTRVSACRPRPAAPPPRPGGGAATLLCDAPAVPACLPRVNGNNAYFFLILYTFRARARDVRPRGRGGRAPPAPRRGEANGGTDRRTRAPPARPRACPRWCSSPPCTHST